jgi:hypothetical protein
LDKSINLPDHDFNILLKLTSNPDWQVPIFLQ